MRSRQNNRALVAAIFLVQFVSTPFVLAEPRGELSPEQGPGGPILVITSATNPYSTYYAEILRCEGMNEFFVVDIASVTQPLLDDYDVVILGEMALGAPQVGILANWVTAGGNLIAMRPDTQLASLLGLTPLGGTLTSARPYFLVNTASPPGTGIVGETMQFHGAADLYSLDSATAIATLYSDVSTATGNPAVTLRSVGSNGGQAAAFVFDVAKSVIQTRQGNPAWSGQERDGIAPIRSDDLFYGNAAGDPQPDWVNLDKVAIPQADELQRLLANLIHTMNLDKKPLLRFWYLPSLHKAVVVMTGDEHGCCGGSRGRFELNQAQSPPGCSVEDWECVRATSYVYNGGDMTDAEAAVWESLGFELAVHVTSFCSNWTPATLEANYSSQLAAFGAQFPSLAPVETNRTHCIAFSDYDSEPQTEATHGIRLDTNYYYWPPAWVANRPGVFTGSGMAMRFARFDGSMIDCYQLATQMTDESNQTYPYTCDVLLDRAIGAEGFYGAFCANMHTDTANHSGNNAIVASAQARGVPVISARQLLTWLDGRSASHFENIIWSGNQLGFSIAAHAQARNLRAMVPATSAIGELTGITRNGGAVGYSVETIKGVSYAFFAGESGDFVATYDVDTTPPLISDLIVTPSPTDAVITWNTQEPADSHVNFGTGPELLDQTVYDPALVTSHSITLENLTNSTVYYFRIQSADAQMNTVHWPEPQFPADSFVTPAPNCAGDTTLADFSAGQLDSAIALGEAEDGEITLSTAVAADFGGAALPAGWTCSAWSPGGGCTVAGSELAVDRARVGTDAVFGPGRSLEFRATFGADTFQHVGFVSDFDFNAPWAIFSTFNGGALFARTSSGVNTPLPGSWLNVPHDFRIDWTASGFDFAIDGASVATIPFAVATNMRPMASEIDVAPGVLKLDRLTLSPFAPGGTFLSRVLDGGQARRWQAITWTSDEPEGTSVLVSMRVGATPVPDATWSPFVTYVPFANVINAESRYAQYRADLATTAPNAAPRLESVSVSCLPVDPEATPRIMSLWVSAAANGTSVRVSWSTNEASDSKVIHGTSPLALVNEIHEPTMTFSHEIEINGLSPGGHYYLRVASEDADGLVAVAPVAPEARLFITPIVFLSDCAIDDTPEDFGFGTIDQGAIITAQDGGGVSLRPVIAAEFDESLPPYMEGFPWSVGGTVAHIDGSVVVDGARVNSEPAPGFGPGSSLEFTATFSAVAFQHIGFAAGNDTPPGQIFNSSPWAMFSTGTDGTSLKTRIWTGGTTLDFVIPGSFLGAAHRYRIDWQPASVAFFVDDVLVRSEAVSIASPMRPGISDLTPGGPVLACESMTMTPHAAAGTFVSRVFDAGNVTPWDNVQWTAVTPPGTTLAIHVRGGDTPIPDETWSAFSPVAVPGQLAGLFTRFIQYRAELSTTDPAVTPVLDRLVIRADPAYTFVDVPAFVTALLDLDPDPDHLRRADLNCDSQVNGVDITLFTEAAF